MPSYTVYPIGMRFTDLADAQDCAKLDSTTNEDLEAWVEDDESEETIARFKDGEQTLS
jgi:hypothetical protein